MLICNGGSEDGEEDENAEMADDADSSDDADDADKTDEANEATAQGRLPPLTSRADGAHITGQTFQYWEGITY